LPIIYEIYVIILKIALFGTMLIIVETKTEWCPCRGCK